MFIITLTSPEKNIKEESVIRWRLHEIKIYNSASQRLLLKHQRNSSELENSL
jgi:hypothetical protein